MMADPSLGAPRLLATRDHRFTVIPGGYKFMVKPIIYIDSEIVYEEYNMQVYGNSDKLLPRYGVALRATRARCN